MRRLADELRGRKVNPHVREFSAELASIYGGPTTGRDTAAPADLAPPNGLFILW